MRQHTLFTNRPIVLVLLVLMLTGLACGLPLPPDRLPTLTPAASNTSAVLSEQATATLAVAEATVTPLVMGEAPTPTESIQATITITATNTEPAPQTSHFEFQGVSLDYPPALASGLTGQIVPAEVIEANGIGWVGATPDYYQLDFAGFTLADGSHKPQVFVYPIQTYAQINSPAGEIANLLQQNLYNQNYDPDSMPFLPMWNAAQVFSAGQKFLPIADGGGLRYLTCYAQAFVAIDSHCLFYTFQGITADGNYYVAAIFPVSLPALEASEVQSKFDVNAADVQWMYAEYLKAAEEVLQAAQAGDFSPKLDDLDAVMESLVIKPSTELKAPDMPVFTCAGALETRLKTGMQARVTFTDGNPLNVRQGAGKSNKVVGTLKEGAAMDIVDGPVCVDQGVWWMIQAGKVTGWVLEGSGTYYIEPKP